MKQHQTYFNWSTGKDSALALHQLLNDERFSVEHLVTSVNAHHDRVSMHGVRRELLQQQLDAIGLPSSTIELPEMPSNEDYEKLMTDKVTALKNQGFSHSAFGDIFLEDLRKYREEKLQVLNIRAHFPLWKRDTSELMHEFVDLGFKAVVVCINADLLDKSFVGRELDLDFLKDLPKGIDPCGENGEFHTFCYAAPYFKKSIQFKIGEKVLKEYKHGDSSHGFWFCDLIAAAN